MPLFIIAYKIVFPSPSKTFDIYKYDYNVKGSLTKVYVDGVNTLSYNYDENYNLTSEVYANGQSIRYEYDENKNLVRQYHNDDTSPYVTYTYNADNELTQKVNSDTGLKYEYGENGNVSIYKTSDNTLVQSYTEDVTEADEENNVEAKTEVTETHFGTTYSSTIKDKSVSYSTGNDAVEYGYIENDDLVNADSVKYNNSSVLTSEYTYDNNGNITEKNYGDSRSVANTYDTKGRISSTSYNSKTYNYTYDANSQLTAVSGTDYNAAYAYDNRGNITNKTVNGTNTTFSYSNDGWNDKLTSVNGTALTYDENGNVLTYGDKEFTWNSGRNLESIVDGGNTYSYTYDESGIRTSKTVNGITTYYNTKDGVILSQTDGTNTMYFQYDTSGTPLGFIYNNVQYFYLTNQMGDVIAITDVNGTIAGNYEYDAWGAVTLSDSDIANINPIRYRGYYYDTETSYYYLQSRYYDPSVCRFINADDLKFVDKNDIIGLNIFAYCGNNPVNYVDYEGNSYSPSKAKSYADSWWHSRNTSKYKTNPADCANFVSQCLYAGNLSSMTGAGSSGWHHYKVGNIFQVSDAWGKAKELHEWLKSKKHILTPLYTIYRKSDVNAAGKILYSRSCCSAIIFFDWNDKSQPKGINHTALSGQVYKSGNSYDIYYYAHTANRNGKKSGGYSLKDVYSTYSKAIIYIYFLY